MTMILNSIAAIMPFLLLFMHSESTKDFFDPMERSVTNRYRGFFALLVILHHMAQRVTEKGLLWIYYDSGYLAVAVFFFYSGYGLMKKGISQKTGFFRKRLKSLLIPYVLTMIIYWILYAVTGDVKSLSSLMTEHFHNESGISFLWYVFSYLAWILFLGCSLRLIRKDRQILWTACMFAAVYITVCVLVIPQYFWIYNTIILIPCGCAWAYYEKNIVSWIHAHYKPVLAGSLILFAISCFGHAHMILKVPAYMLSAVIFIIFLNTLTMKLRPQGKVPAFLGIISYEIYVLHGIPVTFLKNAFADETLWTWSVLIIAVISAYLMGSLGKLTWKKNK